MKKLKPTTISSIEAWVKVLIIYATAGIILGPLSLGLIVALLMVLWFLAIPVGFIAIIVILFLYGRFIYKNRQKLNSNIVGVFVFACFYVTFLNLCLYLADKRGYDINEVVIGYQFLFAFALPAIALLIASGWRRLYQSRLRKPHCCQSCGYNQQHGAGERCPECGSDSPLVPRQTPLAVKRRRTMLIYLAAGILAVVMSLVPFLFSQQELMSSFIGFIVLFGAIGLGVVGYQYSRDIMMNIAGAFVFAVVVVGSLYIFSLIADQDTGMNSLPGMVTTLCWLFALPVIPVLIMGNSKRRKIAKQMETS